MLRETPTVERVQVPGFEAKATQSPRGIKVELIGELDLASHESVGELIDRIPSADGHSPGVAEIDLGELSFADVSGVRAIEHACRHLASLGWTVQLLNLRPNVRKVAELAASPALTRTDGIPTSNQFVPEADALEQQREQAPWSATYGRDDTSEPLSALDYPERLPPEASETDVLDQTQPIEFDDHWER